MQEDAATRLVVDLAPVLDAQVQFEVVDPSGNLIRNADGSVINGNMTNAQGAGQVAPCSGSL